MVVSSTGSDEENPIIKDILNEHLLCAKWFAENQGNSTDLFHELSRLLITLSDNNMLEYYILVVLLFLIAHSIIFWV